MAPQVSWLNVGQEVEAKSKQLNDYQSQAKGVASRAESRLTFSKEMLKQTQAKVGAEEEIWTKTREMNEKRSKKTQLVSQGELNHLTAPPMLGANS
ncbi:hypothetical protein QQZ08_007944 [Neonectria magnoliae]|uniref:Uncharacterized protein n=1 Tax=Neonectria magnoliae TaxID=2732573 RepID=A0ABR1HX42_9HYPO